MYWQLLTPELEKAVSNFFTPASQKKSGPITWRLIGTSVVIGKYSPEGYTQVLPKENRRIAAFDLVMLCSWTETCNSLADYTLGLDFDQDKVREYVPQRPR